MVIAANSSNENFFKISTDPDVKKAYNTAKRMDTIIDLYSFFDSEGFIPKFNRLLDEGKAVFTGRPQKNKGVQYMCIYGTITTPPPPSSRAIFFINLYY